MENRPIKRVVAYTPIVMSLIALAIILKGITEFGLDPAHYPKDEGWEAHLWQLLMVLEIPIILLFIAAGWRSLKRIWPLATLQVTLWVTNLAAVYFLKL